MARRLEGQTFVTDYNNGVNALAHINVRDHFRMLNEMVGFLREKGHRDAANELWRNFATKAGPIFTFVSNERMERDRGIYSGDTEMFKAAIGVIEAEGGTIDQGLFVPFSNGSEHGFHGEDAKANEMVWHTEPNALHRLLYGN